MKTVSYAQVAKNIGMPINVLYEGLGCVYISSTTKSTLKQNE
jgi:hypothetical protein